MYATRQAEPSFLGVKVQPDSSHCGIQLSTLKVPERCILLGVLRRDQVISISENPAIYVGDIILAIALYPMFVPELKVVLRQSHPVYYSLQDCLLEDQFVGQCC
jgi:hypothetical protein